MQTGNHRIYLLWFYLLLKNITTHIVFVYSTYACIYVNDTGFFTGIQAFPKDYFTTEDKFCGKKSRCFEKGGKASMAIRGNYGEAGLFLLCIDGEKAGEIYGSICHYLDGSVYAFFCVEEMIRMVNEILEYSLIRTEAENNSAEFYKGRQGESRTLMLRIYHREGSQLKGQICEGKKAVNFADNGDLYQMLSME